MFLQYIDESGKPAPSDPTPIFCLVGIAFHKQSWSKINKDYISIKKSFFPNLGPYEEVKASDIINYSNKENRRNMRFVQCIINMALKRHPKIFAVSLYKNEFYSSYKKKRGKDFDYEAKTYPMCLKKIAHAFNDYLTDERNSREKGLLILDSRSFYGQDITLAKTINQYIFETQDRDKFNILESPFFGHSQLLPNLQIADFLSYIVRGRLTYTNYVKTKPEYAEKFKHLNQFWRQIKDEFCLFENISEYTS